MLIRAENSDPAKKKTKSLCYFVAEKSDLPLGFPKTAQKLTEAVKEAVKETKAKLGAISIIHTHGLIPAQRILVAGLGPRHKITHESLRITSGKIAKKVSEIGLDEYSVVIPNNLPVNLKKVRPRPPFIVARRINAPPERAADAPHKTEA